MLDILLAGRIHLYTKYLFLGILKVTLKNLSVVCVVITFTLITSSVFISTFTINAFAKSSVEIFPIDSKPFGQAYEEYVKNYWKLLLPIPIEKNPMEDKTGERCHLGQENSNSSVFYLYGSTGGVTEITCKIPLGLGLFIPISTVEASEAESPKATVDELHKISKNDQDQVTSLLLKINGTEYSDQDLRKYRTHTQVFEVVFPENALFGAAPGRSKVVADGFYVITKPLPEGNYTIETKTSLACLEPDCTAPTFVGENKYHLIVQK